MSLKEPRLGKAVDDHGILHSSGIHEDALAELRAYPRPRCASKRPRQGQQVGRRDADEVDAESYTDNCCSNCSPRPQWVDCKYLQMIARLLCCAQPIAAVSSSLSSTLLSNVTDSRHASAIYAPPEEAKPDRMSLMGVHSVAAIARYGLTDLGRDEMTPVSVTLLGRSAPIDLYPSSSASAALSTSGRLPTSAGTLGAGIDTAAALQLSACRPCLLKG